MAVSVVTVVVAASTHTAMAAAGSFSDVKPGDAYYTAIMDLAGRGVVSGFGDGGFRADAPVTRQQFAKMIVRALGFVVTGKEVCPFADVAAQAGGDPFYPSKYVAVCAANGITAGTTAATFEPLADITRQQLISMVVRASRADAPPPEFTPPFTAAGFSSEEQYRNARTAAYTWLLHGFVGMGADYDFTVAATRGECAQLIYQLREESLPAGCKLLFADDFTTKWAGRLEVDNGVSAWRYDLERGEYGCGIYTAKLQSRQAPAEKYGDFGAEVEGRCVGEGGCGLVFRLSADWGEFYEFIVFNKGFWQLWHKSGNEWSELGAERDNYSDAIAQRDAWNRLKVEAYGDKVAVSVNGVQVFATAGVSTGAGRIGLLAQASGATGGATVAFDNYRVWSAPAGAGGR